MNSNLQKGARGDSVKELQKMLRDAGYFTYPTNTGYFGDITEAALKRYQQDKGLEVNGVYSPKVNNNLGREKEAQDFLTSIRGTSAFSDYEKLYKANDPRFYAGMDSIKNPINAGQYAGGGVVITPEQLSQYEKVAKDTIEPYYNDRAKYEAAIYNNDVDSLMNDYNLAQQQLQSQATSDYDALNKQEGARGTWSSSARQQRLNSLQESYNNKFSQSANSAYGQLNKANLGREYNYGTGSVAQSPLLRYTTQMNQFAPPAFQQSSQTYNPFGSIGGYMDRTKEASVQTGKEKIKQGQYYNPFQYL